MFKVIKKDDELGAYIEDINLSNISKKKNCVVMRKIKVSFKPAKLKKIKLKKIKKTLFILLEKFSPK